MRHKVAVWLVTAGFVATACGSQTSSTQASNTAAGGKVNIVASTSVWGSVVSAVAGDHGQVESIIASPVDDPHSFEASPADAAAIADAQLVVYNGGGYDHFVEDVLAGKSAVKRVDAFTVGGHQPDTNPHVFYDLPTVTAVATNVADQLATIDAANAAAYRANAEQFNRQTDSVAATEKSIAASHSGAPVIATEDVAYFLISATKLSDRTPEGYYKAIDGDTDPAPADMAAMLDLIRSRGVKALVFNPQTATSATQRIIDAAREANVPMVNVTETLPEHTDFIGWQRSTVDALGNALK